MIPVTVITGFLGAGKTTLLNRLLKRPEMEGTAVLINEFGEIGLDHLLVERIDEDTVLLNAGCLCCTVRGDLVRALRELAAKIEQGRAIRRVAIETTGLADPAPILMTLMSDPVVLRAYRLDGVVTLVDAVNGAATLDAQPEALKQAAVADRLVLTKTDIASPHAAAAIGARLHALNPGAPLLRAREGDIDPDALLGAGPFDPDAKAPDVRRWLDAEAFGRHDHDHHEHHHHGHHHHGHAHGQDPHDPNRHDARIRAFCLSFDQPLHWEGIATWIEMLIMTRGDALLRVKGILNLAGEERPVILHGVQHVFHPPIRLPAWPTGDDRRSRIVFITRDLTRETIESGLAAFNQAAAEAPRIVG